MDLLTALGIIWLGVVPASIILGLTVNLIVNNVNTTRDGLERKP